MLLTLNSAQKVETMNPHLPFVSRQIFEMLEIKKSAKEDFRFNIIVCSQESRNQRP